MPDETHTCNEKHRPTQHYISGVLIMGVPKLRSTNANDKSETQ